MKWITQNEHWALIDRSFTKLNEGPLPPIPAIFLLEFLEKKATEMNFPSINLDAALSMASYLNKREVVVQLLRKGVDINTDCGIHGTALQLASGMGHEEIVRVLLKNGANVNAHGGQYGTALQAASASFSILSKKDPKEYAFTLVGKPVYRSRKTVYEKIDRGSSKGLEEIIKLLLKNGANVNAEGGYFGTALQAASATANEEIVGLLLENGADVNVQGGQFGTALTAAVNLAGDAVAKLLLKEGADVNAKGEGHQTPLEAAVEVGVKAIVQLLLNNGAVVTDKAMEMAVERGNGEVTKLIRNARKSQFQN